MAAYYSHQGIKAGNICIENDTHKSVFKYGENISAVFEALGVHEKKHQTNNHHYGSNNIHKVKNTAYLTGTGAFAFIGMNAVKQEIAYTHPDNIIYICKKISAHP